MKKVPEYVIEDPKFTRPIGNRTGYKLECTILNARHLTNLETQVYRNGNLNRYFSTTFGNFHTYQNLENPESYNYNTLPVFHDGYSRRDMIKDICKGSLLEDVLINSFRPYVSCFDICKAYGIDLLTESLVNAYYNCTTIGGTVKPNKKIYPPLFKYLIVPHIKKLNEQLQATLESIE